MKVHSTRKDLVKKIKQIQLFPELRISKRIIPKWKKLGFDQQPTFVNH